MIFFRLMSVWYCYWVFFIVKHLRIFSIIAKSIVCKMPWSEIFNTHLNAEVKPVDCNTKSMYMLLTFIFLHISLTETVIAIQKSGFEA